MFGLEELKGIVNRLITSATIDKKSLEEILKEIRTTLIKMKF